ncbi:hypothetical protein [Cystobacter fuscus]|uniref:hypothetical protein n=1 Tax=Cystobacter fuscus TaxID=43 RepID=UPI0037C06873
MASEFGSIAITGLGMVSSLGHGVIPSCAAARAGILRATRLPGVQVYDGDSLSPALLIGHPVRGAEGFEGVGKRAVLASEALRDLLSQDGSGAPDGATMGLLLNLGDNYFIEALLDRHEKVVIRNGSPFDESQAEYEEKRQRLKENLLPRINELAGTSFHPRFQRIYFEGHAGFVQAVADAIELLRTRMLPACIVGAVDSYLEPSLLQALLSLGVLKTPEIPVGFMPGEGAAFVRLERFEEAQRRGAPIAAVIESPNVSSEELHRFSPEPPLGIALADVLSRTLRGAAVEAGEIGWMLGSLNGDEWRAREWGMARVRTRGLSGEINLWNPAQSFGELGAATAAFATCAATRAFQRGYARGKRILVWVSSEKGTKGALLVRRHDALPNLKGASRG